MLANSRLGATNVTFHDWNTLFEFIYFFGAASIKHMYCINYKMSMKGACKTVYTKCTMRDENNSKNKDGQCKTQQQKRMEEFRNKPIHMDPEHYVTYVTYAHNQRTVHSTSAHQIKLRMVF